MRKTHIFRIALLLLSVYLVFLSCSTEETGTGSSQPFRYKVSRISQDDFSKRALPSEALNQIRLMQNSESRTMMNVFDFMIDTDEITVIEDGDYISYTFPVYRNADNGLTENLVLSKEGNNFNAYLMKYSLDANDEFKLQADIPIDVSNKTEVEPLPVNIDDGTTAMATRTCWNITTVSEICCAGIHDALSIANGEDHCTCPEPPTDYTITMTQVDCPDLSTGPHIIYGGQTTGGGGSGGTGGGGNQHPILTVPVPVVMDHVKALKKIAGNAFVHDKIAELRVKANDPNVHEEDGAQFLKSGSNYTQRNPDAIHPMETVFYPAFYSNTEVVVHMHAMTVYDTPNTSAPALQSVSPVFTVDDLDAFLGLGNFTHYNNGNITGLLVSYAGIFALREGSKSDMEAAFHLLEPVNVSGPNEPPVYVESAEMTNLRVKFQEQVIDPCGDTDAECFKNKFKEFINTFKLSNGKTLGILLFEAILNEYGVPVDWVQL
jgi:hypothetical protein